MVQECFECGRSLTEAVHVVLPVRFLRRFLKRACVFSEVFQSDYQIDVTQLGEQELVQCSERQVRFQVVHVEHYFTHRCSESALDPQVLECEAWMDNES